MNCNFKYFEGMRKKLQENTQVTLAYHFRKYKKKMQEKRKRLRKEQKEKHKRELKLIENKNRNLKQNKLAPPPKGSKVCDLKKFR